MNEFKCKGDVMVFECTAFKIEVVGESHHIKINDAVFRADVKPTGILENAFKVLDMMIEHKARQTRDLKVTEMNFKVNVDTKDAEEAIDKLNARISHEMNSESINKMRDRGVN